MKRLMSREGFTLVELMVVVAIIGILSAIAIPNFRKYQAKAKTSEAKLRLAEVYTAESAVYSDYDTYVSCIQDAGIDSPGANSRVYYSVGFSASVSANATAVTNGMPTCAAPFFYPQTRSVGGSLHTTAPTGIFVNSNGFTAGAEGYIQTNNVTDRWIIDQDKGVDNTRAGWN